MFLPGTVFALATGMGFSSYIYAPIAIFVVLLVVFAVATVVMFQREKHKKK
jgi:hypothetical protein